MQVAFEKADRALPRRIVAEGDMDVRVDKAGDRRHAAGIDDDVGGFDLLRRSRAGPRDPAVVGQDSIAGDERVAPIP